MRELKRVTREDFSTTVYAHRDEWKSETIEAPWISTMLYLSEDGGIMARAQYPKASPHTKVVPIYELADRDSLEFRITPKELQFVKAYLEAIDFTECGDVDQPAHGAELEVYYQREATIDCLSFYQRIACYLSDDQIEDAARDFWFTRNGHGVGFWDGDWPVYGELFDRVAKGYGASDAYFEKPLEVVECFI